MKKIGILGGTFDPFHNQHLNIAKTAYQKLQLDEVWILPTNQNPLKTNVIANNEQRVAMINLVIKDYPWLKLNKYELTNSEPSYTINTVTHFTNTYRNDKFFFIIGCDNLYTLNQWQGIDQLINIVKIVVVNRPHFRKTLELMEKYKCRNLVVLPSSDINSNKIRSGQVINQLDSRINDYINNNLLYIDSRLRFNLDEKRTQHCLNVGEMARKLAIHYDINYQQAQIAGIYHDLCKQWSKYKMKKYLSEHNKTILQEPFPIWHGYVAALYLKNHYLITNKYIIDAITKHTTGAVTMTKLDLIVLLADKVSIERTQPYVEQLRTLAFKDLNLAFKFYLRTLKTHLEAKNQRLTSSFLTIYESWIKKE